jgi:hypothetical protein
MSCYKTAGVLLTRSCLFGVLNLDAWLRARKLGRHGCQRR